MSSSFHSHGHSHSHHPGRVVDMEEQMVLRVPPQMADHIRKMIKAKHFNEDIEFEFDGRDEGRHAHFHMGSKTYNAYLLDLPCILESHKTLDKTAYYKSADIGQMLLVQDPNEEAQPPPSFKLSSGITPPTRDIRRRKWRKPRVDPAEMSEIENEVLRLLKPAENENIEILNPDDYEDLEELNGYVEVTETNVPSREDERDKRDSKIRIKLKDVPNVVLEESGLKDQQRYVEEAEKGKESKKEKTQKKEKKKKRKEKKREEVKKE
jgi:transcription initiation factor TFIID subunit 7